MISIYLHIPFCAQKCPYCSFYSFFANPDIKERLISDYLGALHEEISKTADYISDKRVKSIYLGGGTPNSLSAQQLTDIVDYIGKYFDISDVSELSIELNPYPTEEIYNLISHFNLHFKKWPRLRFSFGIQTFDNQILQDVGRPVSFAGLAEFLRGLRDIKQENMIFNFDFIAFGKFNKTRKGVEQLRDPGKVDFFENFARSKFADSFSLYTLELFSGSKWQSKTPDQAISGTYYGTDDDIYDEFSYLKEIILDAGYHRYELSNFCKPGTSSIHNRVYREMENYIGFGPSASSFVKVDGLTTNIIDGKVLDKETKAVRWTNSSNLNEYQKGNRIDSTKTVVMTEKDILIESFFLGLRTDLGIKGIDRYASVLIPNYKELIDQYKDEGFFYDDDERLILTDSGMDLSNTIITDLLQEV